MVNAFVSLFLGLTIATVGVDGIYGAERFTFGMPMLADGIEYLTVMVGAYGLGEVLVRLEQGFETPAPVGNGGRIATQFPSLREVWDIRATLARSTVLGIVLGVIPGAGATIASFVAYGTEAQYGKRRGQARLRHRRGHRRAADRVDRDGRRATWCRCSRWAFPAAARPR